jgi:hypothetical protein
LDELLLLELDLLELLLELDPFFLELLPDLVGMVRSPSAPAETVEWERRFLCRVGDSGTLMCSPLVLMEQIGYVMSSTGGARPPTIGLEWSEGTWQRS